jgi:hypothetical protein
MQLPSQDESAPQKIIAASGPENPDPIEREARTARNSLLESRSDSFRKCFPEKPERRVNANIKKTRSDV